MTCTAVKHGTASAYRNFACTCPGAREKALRQVKAWRLRRRQGDVFRVDSTGSRRRIRALQRLGYRQEDIAAACGLGPRGLAHVTADRPMTAVATAGKIARAYELLRDTAGPCVESRRNAQRRGYPPPDAWDEDTIDDPAARPWSWTTRYADGVDEVAIERAMTGRRVPLSREERIEAVRRLAVRGHTESSICRLLNVNSQRCRAILARLDEQRTAVAS